MVENWKTLVIPGCKDEKQETRMISGHSSLRLFFIFNTNDAGLNDYDLFMAYRTFMGLRKQEQTLPNGRLNVL